MRQCMLFQVPRAWPFILLGEKQFCNYYVCLRARAALLAFDSSHSADLKSYACVSICCQVLWAQNPWLWQSHKARFVFIEMEKWKQHKRGMRNPRKLLLWHKCIKDSFRCHLSRYDVDCIANITIHCLSVYIWDEMLVSSWLLYQTSPPSPRPLDCLRVNRPNSALLESWKWQDDEREICVVPFFRNNLAPFVSRLSVVSCAIRHGAILVLCIQIFGEEADL